MVKKAVNDKAKVALQPHSNTIQIDQNYPCGNRPTNSTIAKSQNGAMKEPWIEKPKTRGPELLSDLQCFNKLSEKSLKKKEEGITPTRSRPLRKLYSGYQSKYSLDKRVIPKEKKDL